MPNKFAVSNGFFKNSSIWSTTPLTYTPTSTPGAGDVAYSNGYIVFIDENTVVDGLFGISTSNSAPSGSFFLQNNVVLNCSISGIIGNNIAGSTDNGFFLARDVFSTFVTITGNNRCTIIANRICGGNANFSAGVANIGTGRLLVTASTLSAGHGNTSPAVLIGDFAECSITTGAVDCSSFSRVNSITIYNNGKTTITGDLIGTNVSSGRALFHNKRSASLVIAGNVVSGPLGSAIYLPTASVSSKIKIVGNVISNSSANAIFEESSVGSASTTSSIIEVNGNIINSLNGTQAIYSPRYLLKPGFNQGSITYGRSGTGIGSTRSLSFFTTNNTSIFNLPHNSLVRSNVEYGAGSQKGICEIPPISAVSINTSYDTGNSKIGIAFNNATTVFNTLIQSVSTTNSIGDRLKKAATIESTGHLIASFSN